MRKVHECYAEPRNYLRSIKSKYLQLFSISHPMGDLSTQPPKYAP